MSKISSLCYNAEKRAYVEANKAYFKVMEKEQMNNELAKELLEFLFEEEDEDSTR